VYILDFLAGKLAQSSVAEVRQTEYRVLCSGELYNGNVLTSDWRKSDVTRVLLTSPFSLYVVSRPFHDYPQELAVHISVHRVTETAGQFSSTFFPDDVVARDLVSILCVLLRRHLTIATKVSVSVPGGAPPQFNLPGVLPLPIVKATVDSAWPKHPIGVMTDGQGRVTLDDYNPPPLPVDSKKLSEVLSAIANLPRREAEAFVLASRLYAQALQLIGSAPEISYQLLISAIESLASVVLAKYEPSREEMISTKRKVIEKATTLGLTTDQANELAILACADNRWISRRFRVFIMSLVDDTLWTADSLFKLSQDLVPPREKFESVLKNIYNSRSDAVHAGLSWQETIHIGWGPTVPSSVLKHLFMGPFRDPPLVWFERVVNLALNRYLDAEGREKLTSLA
jgi:hypothetical protein